MMHARPKYLAVALALFITIPGCAPKQFVDGVYWSVRQSGARNASVRVVDDWPCMRFDAFLLDELDYAFTLTDTQAARDAMSNVVGDAHTVARHAANNEIDQLPQATLSKLWKRYFADEPEPGDLRGVIRARFWRAAEVRFGELLVRIDVAPDAAAVHAIGKEIQDSVRRSPKDQRGSGPMLAAVAASIKLETGPLDHGGPVIDLYSPSPAAILVGTHPAETTGREDRLLARYAPLIAQERLSNTSYGPEADQIGTVHLSGGPENYEVAIDTGTPSMYAYWQYTWVSGVKRLQLAYTYWFPEHPKLKPIDTESGRIEGATLRMTLDATDRPAVFETVLACGCYHRCYVAERVERAACRENDIPLSGKSFCVEQSVPDKIDWIIPEIVPVLDQTSEHPIVFSRAGYHGIAGISFDRQELRNRHIREDRQYTLRSYEELERLPVGDGFGSMFDSDGLVRGAGRLEGMLLAPTGMLSAGQPRQRGTQLLHWDQYDFDDPHLLDHCLRLPPNF